MTNPDSNHDDALPPVTLTDEERARLTPEEQAVLIETKEFARKAPSVPPDERPELPERFQSGPGWDPVRGQFNVVEPEEADAPGARDTGISQGGQA